MNDCILIAVAPFTVIVVADVAVVVANDVVHVVNVVVDAAKYLRRWCCFRRWRQLSQDVTQSFLPIVDWFHRLTRNGAAMRYGTNLL